ncbi:NifB/NifX family molybdenum-iron cluster-binding protein [Promethearchaeum syntrophicum]|uniref:NifB/NifX family molybdenum-iron cluster-binding protein n=1 Tax=Promethearchaeum syntrophicum TaxID=2594042 RepID=A0A5B9D6E4_9ARCH|nr:NifB/NifX family molybdenum-iron cluster-binding protein [Candidatus Prometheoarchaeum syntrophicum]
MSTKKIAFPGTVEGLNGELVGHFGHTPTFLTIEYDENTKAVITVEVIQNSPHEQGGCMTPVMLLKNNGVSEVVVGGIGQRPLMGFIQVGIEPYRGIQGTIKQNFEAFKQNLLKKLSQATCQH